MAHTAWITSAWLMLLLAALLSGCATAPAVYDPIADPAFKGPQLKLVRIDTEAYLKTRVRWGGSIAKVTNERDDTLIEVVEQQLDDDGRPYASGESEGRFMARFRGFLDPAVYAEGKLITIIGTVVASTQGKIGQYPYSYPLVAVDVHKLWPERRDVNVYYYPDPFWYGPWYGPYFPGYPRYYYPPRKRSD